MVRGDFSDSPHPIAHIPSIQSYEWMREDCAALDMARQQREDSVTGSITNIASTALLGIPGLMLGTGTKLPSFNSGWSLYLGFLLFFGALVAAIWEQILSGIAYQRQIEVTQSYYLRISTERLDSCSISRVTIARNVAIGLFAVAVLSAAGGMATLGSTDNGKLPEPTTSATTSAASTSASTSTSTSTSTPPASTAATATGGSRQSRSEKIGAKSGSASTAKKVIGE